MTGAGQPRYIAVSPDGKFALSCAVNDSTISLWDLETGVLTYMKTPYSAVSGLAFLPGSKSFLYSANDAKLHRWNLTTQAPDQAGKQWTQLFNGKDLTGWKTHPDDKTQWSVKDGILIGEPPIGLLFSERDDYTDFHFRVEARINDGGDSGLFFRVRFAPWPASGRGVPPGYEAQIDGKTNVNAPHTGSLFAYGNPPYTREEMEKLYIREVLVKPNEWFTYEVIAVGNHIIIKVNGKTTVDFVDKANRFRKGHLAIQQSGPNNLIHIRKAELLELSDDASMESEGFGGGSPEGHPTKVDSLVVSADGKIAVTGCHDKVRSWNLETDKRLPGEWSRVDSPTVSLSIAANGKVAVSQHANHSILVWDTDSGSRLMTFDGSAQGGKHQASAVTPDGRTVVTGTAAGDILFHEVEGRRYNAKKLANLGLPVIALAVSADGRYLAAAGSSPATKTLAIYDMASGKELHHFDNTPVMPGELKFATAANCLLAAGDDSRLRVFAIGKNQDSVLPITWQGHTNRVSGVAFSPDGRRIVSSGEDGVVKIWDGQTCKMVLELKGHLGSVYGVAWSANGKRIASASMDKTVKVWDADTGALLLTLTGHTGPVSSVAFSTDNQRIVSGGGSKEKGEVIVWDAARGGDLLTLQGHTGGVMCVAISPDGKRIVSGSWDTTLKVWDANTGKVIYTMKGHGAPVVCVAFSPNGQRIVSGGGDATLKIWDASNGKELNTLKSHTAAIYSLAISSDGKRIISASLNTSLKEWDADSGKLLRDLRGYTSPIFAVAYSSDGNRIVSGTADGILKFYPGAKGRNQDPAPVVRNAEPGVAHLEAYSSVGPRPPIRCMTVAKNGQVVTVHSEGSIRLWKTTKESIRIDETVNDPKKTPTSHAAVGNHVILIASDRVLQMVNLQTHNARPLFDLSDVSVQGLEVSGDDSLAVITAIIKDRYEVIVLDLVNNKKLAQIFVPFPVKAVRLLPPNGEFLLIGGESLGLVESRTGKTLRNIWQGQSPVHSLAVTPDGRLAIVGDQSGLTHAIEIANGQERYQLDGPPDQAPGGIGISPSGKVGMLVMLKGQRSSLQFFDVATGRKLGRVDDAFNEWVCMPVLFDDEHLLYAPAPPTKVDAFTIRLPKEGVVAKPPDSPPPSNSELWKTMGVGRQVQDLAPEGGVLVGLELGLTRFGTHDVIGAYRAIFQDAKGEETKGTQYGTDLMGVVTVKAKPGYAVAGISGKAVVTMDGMRVIFMRLRPDGKLDPSDSYTSDWIGGPSVGAETRLGGDGTLIIGVNYMTQWEGPNGFGLIPKQP